MPTFRPPRPLRRRDDREGFGCGIPSLDLWLLKQGFYERFGFERSPTDPLNLQLLVKDIRATVAAAR